MQILIADDYQHATARLACVAKVAAHGLFVAGDLAREPDIDRHLAAAEALVLIRERTNVDAELLRRMPRLRVIGQTAKIGRNLDLAACTAAGVAVTEGVGSPIAPAELAWLLMMAARRRFVGAVDGLYRGAWQTTIGAAMHGAVLGVLGYGKIGKLIAGFGRAFGMQVQVWGSERARSEARAAGLVAAASRAQFFADADIVSVHLRLTPETKGSVGAVDLAQMKPDALFVNTSRADLVPPGVLEAALAAGRPGFAALDVFEAEPIYDPAHPLLQMKNVLCSPHLGYVELGSYELYLGSVFDNLLRFDAGDRSHVINPQALTASSQRS
jgi:D-3-phosphoglycerate dehydrogenase / 2-oxoglutarate reductase